jgi:hypothetical protein
MMQSNLKSPSTMPLAKVKPLIYRLINAIELEEVKWNSIGDGRSSLAMMYLYAGNALKDENLSQKGIHLVEEVFNGMDDKEQSILHRMDYYGGLCGFLSVLANLTKYELLEFDLSSIASLDELLADWACQQLVESNTDFFQGAMGVMNYFIQRLPNAEELGPDEYHLLQSLDLMLRLLPNLFETDDSGNYFIINQHYNRIDDRQEKEVNYGLAHGMCGVLLNVAALRLKGYFKESCDQILLPATKTILRLREKANPPSPFCFVGSLDMDNNRSVGYQMRMGWCYSDLNLVQLFIRLQKIYGKSLIPTEMMQDITQRLTSRKDFENTRLEDPFICHGYAGVSQYYRKLFHESGVKTFEEASKHWLLRSIQFYEEEDNQHFFTFDSERRRRNSSFFYGQVGVVLCLLSAIDAKFSNWSETILL